MLRRHLKKKMNQYLDEKQEENDARGNTHFHSFFVNNLERPFVANFSF